jgi:hypothetical protein
MRYLSAEIEGSAASSARLIAELRCKREELLIDQRGFLLIPEEQWETIEQIAAKYGCELRRIERSRAA